MLIRFQNQAEKILILLLYRHKNTNRNLLACVILETKTIRNVLMFVVTFVILTKWNLKHAKFLLQIISHFLPPCLISVVRNGLIFKGVIKFIWVTPKGYWDSIFFLSTSCKVIEKVKKESHEWWKHRWKPLSIMLCMTK